MNGIETAAVQNRDNDPLQERAVPAALRFILAVMTAWSVTIGLTTWWLLECFVL